MHIKTDPKKFELVSLKFGFLNRGTAMLSRLYALLALQHWTSLEESDQLHFEIEQLKLEFATAIVH